MYANATGPRGTAANHDGSRRERKSTEGAESGVRSSPGYLARKVLRKCKRSGTAILDAEADAGGAGGKAGVPRAGLGGAAEEASNSSLRMQEESADTSAASSVSAKDSVEGATPAAPGLALAVFHRMQNGQQVLADVL